MVTRAKVVLLYRRYSRKNGAAAKAKGTPRRSARNRKKFAFRASALAMRVASAIAGGVALLPRSLGLLVRYPFVH